MTRKVEKRAFVLAIQKLIVDPMLDSWNAELEKSIKDGTPFDLRGFINRDLSYVPSVDGRGPQEPPWVCIKCHTTMPAYNNVCSVCTGRRNIRN